jgi:hypothetical protein
MEIETTRLNSPSRLYKSMQTGCLDTGKTASDWLDKGLFARRTQMSQQEGQRKRNDMDELGEQI